MRVWIPACAGMTFLVRRPDCHKRSVTPTEVGVQMRELGNETSAPQLPGRGVQQAVVETDGRIAVLGQEKGTI